MMKRLTCVLLVAAGCEKEDPLFCEKNPTATGCTMDDADVDPDGEIDMFVADAQQIFGAGAYTISLMAPPMGELPLTGMFDTSTNTSCLATLPADWDAAQDDACIVAANNIMVTNLDVIGNRPLVLLARTTLSITGFLDVSSRRATLPKTGPGANDPSCAVLGTPGSSANGAGGGAGATFTTKGGNGGDGDTTLGTVAVAVSSAMPATLRGGCRGGTGGAGDSSLAGTGGAGGGAAYFVAGVSIVLAANAIVNASGAGASASDDSAGGGGGGSGGMLVLFAPEIMGNTGVKLVANGGGGSAGATDANNGGNPLPGGDPDPMMPAMPAAGGGQGGAMGGNGSSLGTDGFNGQDFTMGNYGGGGGGGGAGFIQTNLTIANVSASPTPVVQ